MQAPHQVILIVVISTVQIMPIIMTLKGKRHTPPPNTDSELGEE